MAGLLDMFSGGNDPLINSWLDKRLGDLKTSHKLPEGVDLRETLGRNLGSENQSRHFRATNLDNDLKSVARDLKGLQEYAGADPERWARVTQAGGPLDTYDPMKSAKFYSGEISGEQARGGSLAQEAMRATQEAKLAQVQTQAPRGIMAIAPEGPLTQVGGGGSKLPPTSTGATMGLFGQAPGGPGNEIVPRNMQQVGPAAKDVTGRGYRVYENALPGPEGVGKAAAKVGRGGLLGALGAGMAAYDLIQGANDKFGTGAWDNAQDIVNRRDVRQAVEADPGLPQRGVDTVNRITERAMGGVKGLMDQATASRAAEARTLPMTPEKTEVAATATQDPAIEAGRQRIQEGTLRGLQTGQVHVSDLAKGVVQADAQRAGTELSPEEEKSAVASEIQAMKTMDKSQLSQYVSYALIAGGVLASVFDKSGQAGAAFHDSLNKQLDRNLAAGKMAFDQKMAVAKNAREDRKVDISESDVESKIGDRKVRQEQGERGLEQGDRRLGIMEADSRTKAFAANSSAANARARLGLMGDANELKRESLKLRQRAQDWKEKGGGREGEPLTTKDAGAAVDAWASEKGIKLSSGAKAGITQSLRNAVKDPSTRDYAVGDILDTLQDDYETVSPTWYQSDSRVRIPKPKEQ